VPSHDPTDRHLIAGIAADMSWAKTRDRTARTANGRAAFADRFEREVDALDPDGTMSPADRAKAVENARRAYFRQLARRSRKARTTAKTATAEAEAAEAELAEAQATEPAGSANR
jgi:ketosteroid isomerase-like protein